MVISACAQEVNFECMLLEEMTEVQNTSVIYENNQGAIFLSKNIDICHYFLRNIVEDKDIDIWYICREDNPANIMTKNNLEADFERHMKRITDGEQWELVDTGRENVKNTRVTDDVIIRDKNGYSSHTLVEVVDGKHKNYWILVTI